MGYIAQEAIEVGVWEGLCWRQTFRGMQQQGSKEVGAYTSRGLERVMLEGEFSWGIAQEAI